MCRLCLGNHFLDQAITTIAHGTKQSFTIAGTFELVLKTAQAHFQSAILFRFPADAEDQFVTTDDAFFMVQHLSDQCGFKAGKADLDTFLDECALIIVQMPGFCAGNIAFNGTGIFYYRRVLE